MKDSRSDAGVHAAYLPVMVVTTFLGEKEVSHRCCK